jgi:uncharacterized protein YcbK (DUF882 family)
MNSSLVLSRRNFLYAGLGAGIAGAGLFSGLSQHLRSADRELNIFIPLTGERVRAVFWSGGEYVKEGIAELQTALRDFVTNEVGTVEIALLEILHHLGHKLNGRPEFEIVRGYMTNHADAPFTNGSPDSYHTAGQAVDLRIAGLSLEHIAMEFINLVDGGVGVYPVQNFVHLDIGPQKRWQAVS